MRKICVELVELIPFCAHTAWHKYFSSETQGRNKRGAFDLIGHFYIIALYCLPHLALFAELSSERDEKFFSNFLGNLLSDIENTTIKGSLIILQRDNTTHIEEEKQNCDWRLFWNVFLTHQYKTMRLLWYLIQNM